MKPKGCRTNGGVVPPHARVSHAPPLPPGTTATPDTPPFDIVRTPQSQATYANDLDDGNVSEMSAYLEYRPREADRAQNLQKNPRSPDAVS